jgi:serine protease AprX
MFGRGVSWQRRALGATAAVAAIATLGAGPVLAEKGDGGKSGKQELVHVIVRLGDGVSVNSKKLMKEFDGKLEADLAPIGGFAGFVPADKLDDLRAVAGVTEVTTDVSLNWNPTDPVATTSGDDTSGFVDGDFGRKGASVSYDRLDLTAVNKIIGANAAHKAGYTGAGVDVALIDTGVSPVAGVGSVLNGPDLSFDSQQPGFEYLDGYGHGTYLSGIINGSGAGVDGVAPGSRIVNVKVGAANGAVDVSQVIAGIDWVVQHRSDPGVNIRVLVLAYGTDSVQPADVDPLAYAVEVAWQHGIVVVAAAGNRGTASPLDDPAMDPYVIAVGASEPQGTFSTADDLVTTFTNGGTVARRPDLVAPGRSVVSLRVPGSYVDLNHPEGLEPDGLLRGSGTSQASAVVGGSAALLLQAQPSLTPDQVKAQLKKTAMSLPLADPVTQGAGQISIKRAIKKNQVSATKAAQTWPLGTGTGSLEAARGTSHVEMNGVPLIGELDIFGMPWDGQSWSGQSWSGQSWSGGVWNGQSWSGQSWSGQSWSGQSWSGQSWSGQSWSGQSWSGQSWSGQSWSGQSWSGQSWSGQSWSGVTWSGQSWSSAG